MTESLFTPHELEILAGILNEYLSELRTEIRETDSYTFKQDLRLKEQILRDILMKIEQTQLSPVG